MKKGTEKPWERQPGESGQAFEAFALYRDKGLDRSCAAVARELSKSVPLIKRWCSRYDWVDRVAQYENYLSEKARRKAEKDREDMDTRHSGLALQVQKRILEALNQMEAGEVPSQDMIAAIRLATDLERTSRHGTVKDRELELKWQMFEYQKGKDSGENVELEDLSEVEADIYGDDT